MPKNLPDSTAFVGAALAEHPDYRIARALGNGQRALVFVATNDSLGRDAACKVIPLNNLVGTPGDQRWRREITAANQIASGRVVKIFGMGQIDIPEHKCLYLLSDLVKGHSLKDHLKSKEIDLGFVESFLREMLDFLRELQAAGQSHGDFHPGNILVEDRSDALTGPPFSFRVTDFGVAPITTGPSELLDDYHQLASMLREMLGKVDYQQLGQEDRHVFNFLDKELLGKRLLEHDVSFDPAARSPRALFDALRRARTSAVVQSAGPRTLSTPFDYLSCEQIGEAHSLLKELYSDKMLGLVAIQDANNLVLTGPRGCGKTTVFRSLSLRHRTYTNDDSPTTIQYIGVYYRCDDLYFSFPRYKRPAREEALDIPLHFVTATLLRELLIATASWLSKHSPDAWRDREAEAAAALWDHLDIKKPESPDANTIPALVRRLEKERDWAAKKHRFAADPSHSIEGCFGPAVLPRACEILASHFVYVRERPVHFLVDDYSAPKITPDLQRNLNRIFMQRTSSCFFKLATESPRSFDKSDVDGKTYVEGREFRLMNLGMDFINAARDEKLRFVDDIFTRRLKYTPNYPVRTLHQLVGDESGTSYNEIARQIREGKKWKIWGQTALSELCSGDVHFLIDLAGKMANAGGGPAAMKAAMESGEPAIAPAMQNKLIREEAGNFVRNLRSLPRGERLVGIVEAFGSVAASYLRYRDSKNEEATVPHQASRIEPLEDPELAGEARETYDDLLRYSVFLEDTRGKSRRGLVVPRLYLRRFLLPHFNLTFSKRDSLELDVADLKELLLQPAVFEARKRMKDSASGNPDQSTLFPDPDNA